MNNDKKKVVVLVALAVVILGVGAFQFLSNGSSAPATDAAVVKASLAEDEDDVEGGAPKSTRSAIAEYAGDTAGEDPSAEETEEGAAEAAKVETDPLRQLYAVNLAVRDPFMALASMPTVNQGNTNNLVRRAPVRPSGGSSSGGAIMPPFDPLGGSLPPVGGGTIQAPSQSPDQVVPKGPAYSVSGVIRGETNAAVIEDANGNQKLVREGQAIDGDAKVASVQKGRVVIRKKDGKTITLTVGGNP